MPRFRYFGILFVEVLLSALFALQGLLKLTGSTVWIARFRAWGYPEGFYLVVGFIELVGAIALLIPKTRLVGAGLLVVVMVGATITHLRHAEIQALSTTVILSLLLLDIFFRRRLAGGGAALRPQAQSLDRK
jgi:uncharacterized membrane protein YphA (DoxX/SURF4 family)